MLRASKPPRRSMREIVEKQTYTIGAIGAIGLPQRMKSHSAGLPQSHAHDEPSDGAVGPQRTFRTWPDVPVALTFAPGPLLPSTAREGLARTRERRHHSVVDGRMVRIIDPTAGGSAGRCTPRVRVGSFATAVRPIIHVRVPADADTHRHRHCQFNESFGRRTANSYATG